jgi:hypothetical protein
MFRNALRVLLVATAVPALAAPPAAPELIYDAAPKQILLDWNYVPKANWYEIWFKANAAAAWAKLGERPSWYPHRDVNVSAHLLDWAEMRWDVRACNPGGCSPPRSIDIGSTVVNTVGYVKPAKPQAGAQFGAAVDVSENGSTLAVVASQERLDSEPASSTAVIYVYRGNPNNWKPEARLLLPYREIRAIGDGAGINVTLSGDGNVLAVGVPSSAYTIDVGEPNPEHGDVWIYHRNGGAWTYVQAFEIDAGDMLHAGKFTRLSDDGQRLAIAREWDFGNQSLIGVYRRESTGWFWHRDVVVPHHDQTDFNMSGDGTRLFVRWRDGTAVHVESFDADTGAPLDTLALTVPAGYELSSFDVDATGNTITHGTRPQAVDAAHYVAANWKPTVTVYRHDGTAYQPVAVLAPSIHQPTSYAKRSLFGDRVALSSAGTYVAVYDAHDAWGANGVQQPPTSGYDREARGAVYLFEKRGTSYRQRRYLGANGGSPDWVDGQGIFGSMAFGKDGKTFATGATTDDGGYGGIRRSGDPQTRDHSQPESGAVWLY